MAEVNAPDVRPFGYIFRKTCPCCGEDSVSDRGVFASSPPAETLPADRHTTFAPGYKAERVFFTYVTCSVCGVRFCKTFYSEDQLLKLYQEQDENMGQVPLPARTRAQEEYARRLLKHVRGQGAFLEIGADIGLFARYCAANHRFSHYWLLEPNKVVQDELAERMAGQSITIEDGMWPSADIAPRSVSAAVMIHVLDHLLDPLAFLKETVDRLEPGGVLMSVTHNSASLLARALGKRWPPHALQHPQLYTPQSIRRLYERAGLEVVEIAPAVNFFPFMHLVRAAFAIAGVNNVLPAVMGPILPIRLGNMAVVARK